MVRVLSDCLGKPGDVFPPPSNRAHIALTPEGVHQVPIDVGGQWP